ncbi:alpha/beta hydrolase-fold protein [Corynebacterium sp. H113]|uniref:alpha/beta hydrolase-fold protein n=1 Tax=Corynebacterium sp. H113 TaxID=3133419 RepID=UPI0030AAF294
MRVTAHSLRGRTPRALTAILAVPVSLALLAPAAQAVPAIPDSASQTIQAQDATKQDAPATQAPGQDAPASSNPAGDALDALGRAAAANGVTPEELQNPEALKQRSALFMPQPLPGPPRAPFRVDNQQLDGLPSGVSVEKVEWFTERHVMLHINSAAMPDKPMQVELLLPRDWYRDKERTFPSVYHLDGMNSFDDYSGWTRATNIQRFYEDKNVLVVLPAGGKSSFYADWDQPDNGTHYMWESFITKELVPVITKGWRGNNDRGIYGISMGGTGAMNIAAHTPDMWKFVGSLSGYLDTSSPGMPEAMAAAMKNTGGFDATKMWGPLGSKRWKENDPKLNIEKYKGMALYISAGNGNTGEWDRPSQVDPKIPDNPTGYALELLSRLTSETFLRDAEKAGVDATVNFRESGTHTWPYWQFEVSQAWPVLADSLQLSEQDRGATCHVGGAIEQLVASFNGIGTCLSDEYDTTNGGRVQDFTGGRAYWHPNTDAHVVWGRIGSRYAELDGPASPLGFPVSNEMQTPDGKGRFNHFEHGSIYWTPETGAHVVYGDIMNAWGESGWETGPLGYPTAERVEVPGGWSQDFQNGTVIKLGDEPARVVNGAIGAAYAAAGGAKSTLGLPTSGEIKLNRGAFQRFEHGSIYWSPETGAHAVPNGDMMDFWGEKGWENGEYGFPVGPQQNVRAGGLEQEFEGGWIRQLNGKIVEERR